MQKNSYKTKIFNYLNKKNMAKITKLELKQIISEEVARVKKIKDLQEKKKVLQEAIEKMEDGEDLDEISWGGVKSALGFAGKKAGETVGSVVQKAGGAVGSAAQKAGEAFGSAAQKAGSALEKTQTKLKTGLATLDKGVKDFGAELSAAATKGDVQDLNNKINNLLANVVKMGEELNKKEIKLGLPPTKMKSRLTTVGNKIKTVSTSSKPVMAENKNK